MRYLIHPVHVEYRNIGGKDITLFIIYQKNSLRMNKRFNYMRSFQAKLSPAPLHQLSILSNGMYFLHISNAKGAEMIKVIKAE